MHNLSARIINNIIIVDGTWAEWGTWSSCPVTCGGGNLTRTRDCDMDVSGDHVSGAHCSTDGSTGEEYQACGEDPCPSSYFESKFS